MFIIEWIEEFFSEPGMVLLVVCFVLLMFGIAATMGHLEPIYIFFFGA